MLYLSELAGWGRDCLGCLWRTVRGSDSESEIKGRWDYLRPPPDQWPHSESSKGSGAVSASPESQRPLPHPGPRDCPHSSWDMVTLRTGETWHFLCRPLGPSNRPSPRPTSCSTAGPSCSGIVLESWSGLSESRVFGELGLCSRSYDLSSLLGRTVEPQVPLVRLVGALQGCLPRPLHGRTFWAQKVRVGEARAPGHSRCPVAEKSRAGCWKDDACL